MVAEALGMKTVAEGIETTGQAEMMRKLRCHKGQGYLFSRPLALDALLQWLVYRTPAPLNEDDLNRLRLS